MNLLGQSAFLKALGWALLHSLWQMGILWLLYITITADGRRFQSRQRYNIALILLSIGSVSFLYTLAQQFYNFSQPTIIYHSFDEVPAAAQNTLVSKLALAFEPALPFLSAAYLTIIALLFIRFFRQYYFSRKLISSSLHKINPEYRIFLEEMAQRFAINKKIRIGLSDIINTPLTVGFWKPVILLPVAATCHLSVKQTEAIILHELNHIKQNDYLVNLLIATLDILLFFNPFSRLLSSVLVKERENSCDDMVLQFRYPATDYAHALLVLEQQRLQAAPLLAVNATGTHKKMLLNRVERILHGKHNSSTASFRLIAFLLSALLIAVTGFYNPAKVIHEQLPDRFANRKIAEPKSAEMVNTLSTSETAKETTPPLMTVVYANNLLTAKQGEEEDAQIAEDANMEDDTEPVDVPAPMANFASTSYSSSYTSPINAQPVIYLGTSVTTAEQPREYSINETVTGKTLTTSPESYYEVQPFVPSNSFSYQLIEDTAFPKRYIPTPSDLKAKEDLERTLKALEEIDWEKLGKEIGGKAKVDIVKLQEEIKKALADVDWKKIEEEIKSGLKQAGQDMKLRQVYLDRLAKFQKDKQLQQNSDQQRKQMIIMDRLMQNDELKKCEEEKKKTDVKKVKKIVVI